MLVEDEQGFKKLPRRPDKPTRRPKTPPSRPKTPPRRAKTAPRRLQDGSKTPQDTPRRPQDAPKTASSRSGMLFFIDFWMIFVSFLLEIWITFQLKTGCDPLMHLQLSMLFRRRAGCHPLVQIQLSSYPSHLRTMITACKMMMKMMHDAWCMMHDAEWCTRRSQESPKTKNVRFMSTGLAKY